MRAPVAAPCLLAFSCLAWCAAAPAQVPRASAVVEPHAYASLEPVPRGRVFEIAVVARIRPGFHLNAHEVSQDYLIPTQLEAALPAGFRLRETRYPPGVLRKFRFSPAKLSVYTGSVVLRMRLEALSAAPLGRRELPLALSYQACNEEACFPPVKVPVSAEIEIAPAGAAARAAHASLFPASPPKSVPAH